MAVTCKCGNIYNERFKFCPECATPNPNMTDTNTQEPDKKKGFVKVGESNLATSKTATTIRNSDAPKPAPVPSEEYYEDDADDAPEFDAETDDAEKEEYYEDEEEDIDIDMFADQSEQAKSEDVNYDPNHDGYYRLPLLANEITKTNITDVAIKSVVGILFIAAIILYCIYYLRV